MHDVLILAKTSFFSGNRHWSDGALAAAEACFREAIGFYPDFAEAHANLALLLDRSGREPEAAQHYARSIACNPDIAQTHLNYGVMLARQKRFEAAEAAYRAALRLDPQCAAAWSNLGVLQACRKQEDAAEQSYRRAIELDADYALARFNFSYLLLRQGRFDEGWRCLEARSWYGPLAAHLDFPRWRGETLRGMALLITIEGGMGDMIQFCRYAAVLKTGGAARIGVICHPALENLFATLAGIDAVYSLGDPLPQSGWDYWTPPLSIPLHCRTRLESIPATLPYLFADPRKRQAWSKRLAAGGGSDLRVGLAWKGNPRFENDEDRSFAHLGALAPLGEVAGVRFFSLQKGAGEDEASNPPPALPVTDLAPEIVDFSDTAAIVDNLDLVISVDTALAHLAGAMGKFCWVLLSDYKTDWRWLTGREDSPWYPRVMRLFRQRDAADPAAGDWAGVIDELRLALQLLVSQRADGVAPGRI